MSAASSIPAKAVGRQWLWKTPAMSRMTLAILRLALAKYEGRNAKGEGCEFSANDLPESLEHGGRGICGTVFNALAGDGIFKAVAFLHDGQWVEKTVRNSGGNKIGVYCLASEPLARELLARHSEPVPEPATQGEQLEMV